MENKYEYEMKPAVVVAGRSVIAPDFEAIEAAGLPACFQYWCVWQLTAEGRKKPTAGGWEKFDPCDPARYTSYEKAKQLYLNGGFDGVGVLPWVAGGVIGLDQDKVLDDSGVEFMAAEIVDALLALDCYVELSPGGKGLRGFVRGVKPDSCRPVIKVNGYSVEAYQPTESRKDNYVTVTGVRFPGTDGRSVVIDNAQERIERYFRAVTLMPAEITGGRAPGGSVGVGVGGNAKVETASAKAGGVAVELWPLLGEKGFEQVCPNYKERTDMEIERLIYSGKLDPKGKYRAVRDKGGASEERCLIISQLAYFTRDAVQIERLIRKLPFDETRLNDKSHRGFDSLAAYDIDRVAREKTASYDEDNASYEATKAGAKARVKAVLDESQGHLAIPIDDLLNERNKLEPSLHTLAELFYRDSRLLGGVIYDEFRMADAKTISFRQLFDDRGAPDSTGPIEELDILAATSWLQRQWGLVVTNKQLVKDAITRWASMCSRNPVKEKLFELMAKYDGVPRLANLFTGYMGTEPESDEQAYYLQEVGKRFLVGTVARALNPGTKQDHMLILENAEGGEGKSYAISVLTEPFGSSYYLDSFEPGKSADELRIMRGKILGEWGELSGYGAKESEWVKQFLTKRSDPYRDPYAMMHRDWPRTISFIATSNRRRYLGDLGGRRRYWPIKVGRVNLDGLRADAEMLWAEAVTRFMAGERYWVDAVADNRLWLACDREQIGRLLSTSYDDLAFDLANSLMVGALEITVKGNKVSPNEWHIFSRDEMEKLVSGIKGIQGPISAGEWKQVTQALRGAGWDNDKNLPNGNTGWRLTRKTAEEIRSNLELGPPPPMPKRMKKSLAGAMAKSYAKEVMRLVEAEEAEEAANDGDKDGGGAISGDGVNNENEAAIV